MLPQNTGTAYLTYHICGGIYHMRTDGGTFMIQITDAAIDEKWEGEFEDIRRPDCGEYEILLFQTKINLGINGEAKDYPEGTCILYGDGDTVHVKKSGARMVYSRIRFLCDEAILRGKLIPLGVPAHCTDVDEYKVYWRAAVSESKWYYGSSSYAVAHLIHIILHRLYDYVYSEEDSGYRKSFLALREQIFQYPERQWTLEEMAQQVQLGVRSLQKFYKNFFGISCMNEVILCRVNRAKQLLSCTTGSIAEISQQCGYNNWEHFSRQFKSRVGMTPTQYRRKCTQEK